MGFELGAQRQVLPESKFCSAPSRLGRMLSYNDASIVVMLKHNAIALLHDILRWAKLDTVLSLLGMTIEAD